MHYPGFIGPSNPEWSPNLDAERTINLYLHRAGVGAKVPWALYNTPGLRVFKTGIDGGPIRALFAQNNVGYVVAGSKFYRLDADGTLSFKGNVALDEFPATLSTNGPAGDQMFIVSAGKGYIYTIQTSAFTQIVDPDFPLIVVNGDFLDGYFVVLESESITFKISDLEDGLSWNGLDVGQVSQSTDKIRRLFVNHEELWLFGGQRTGVWVDTGNASFPFAPLPGANIQQGIAAPWSVAAVDNSFLWLGGNEEGQGVVYRPEGYRPKRVSTSAIEAVWRTYPTISDAVAWTYQQDGHYFYVLIFPSATGPMPTAWVYDTTTDQWHERAHWSLTAMNWVPYRPGCHCFAFGKHLVGDRLTGTIYDMSHEFFDSELVTV